ncbi:unnamed protein product [Oikopleura dioica]|uniref:Uncharacterized protein n=1 Tax=Oikopleura dioica TaxID=34765 RepID=E4XTV7_OIKDI|nr:unnamed protein product [Oikopleura dioica]
MNRAHNLAALSVAQLVSSTQRRIRPSASSVQLNAEFDLPLR